MFDLVITQMVLHHVADIGLIISRFRKLLNPGGYLTIADLYTEDGSFHGPGFTGHKGFDIAELSGLLGKHGFTNITSGRCFVIDKKISDTRNKTIRCFPADCKNEKLLKHDILADISRKVEQ